MVAKSALNSGLGTIGQFSPHLSTVQWCWKSGSIWSLHVFQVVSNIFMFMPIWGRFPFGLFRWVETNQCFFPQSREPFRVSEAEHLGRCHSNVSMFLTPSTVQKKNGLFLALHISIQYSGGLLFMIWYNNTYMYTYNIYIYTRYHWLLVRAIIGIFLNQPV